MKGFRYNSPTENQVCKYLNDSFPFVLNFLVVFIIIVAQNVAVCFDCGKRLTI